ncbi:glutathione S-transferase, partial [Phenoliferia sp. Uapishka_3]
MGANEQKEPWFLAINPNGRIPAMLDNDRPGSPAIWETGSMLLYLAKCYDTNHALHFKEDNFEDEMINWIFFQHGGLGPMQGQAGHFVSAAPEKIPYAARRYIDETKRLLKVYEDRLKDRDYLIGEGRGKFSYADIVAVTWARASHFSLGIPHLSEASLPLVQKWIERIEARDGAKKAFAEDMITKAREKDGWEEESRKKVEWVWKDQGSKKDEL